MPHRSPFLTIRSIAIACWLASSLPTPATGQGKELPGQAPYLDQLNVAREENWIQSEWRKLTSFRYLDRAFQRMQAGRLAEAKTEFERYLERDPADLRARADYLSLLYRIKDYEGCMKQAGLILDKRPSYVPAFLYRGLACQHTGQFEAAIGEFARAAQLKEIAPSDRIFALNSAADLAMQIRKYAEAVKLMEAMPPAGREATFHLRAGMAYEQMGDDAAAASSYRKALDFPQAAGIKAKLHRTIAELAIRQGRWGEPEQELRAALELTPGDSELSRAHAMAVYESSSRNGRNADALAAAENLAENSKDPANRMRVGLAFSTRAGVCPTTLPRYAPPPATGGLSSPSSQTSGLWPMPLTGAAGLSCAG